MAMRRNQPKVQAIDLWVSGMMSSASLRPGEKRAIRGAGTCGSMGTATASARKPAARLSPASTRKRNSPRCGIAGNSNRGFRSFTFLWEDNPDVQKSKEHSDFPANHHVFLNHFRCLICSPSWLAARGGDTARPARTKKATDADDRGVSAKVHTGYEGAQDRAGEIPVHRYSQPSLESDAGRSGPAGQGDGHHQSARDGEPERRHRGASAANRCGDEGALSGSVRGIREHELRRSKHAGVRETRGRAAGAGRQERREGTENLQGFWDGAEVRERAARAHGRSGV